jgi:hypothetical protein
LDEDYTMTIATIFCIDGSGNKNVRQADKKRPIYKLDCSSGKISRLLPNKDKSVFEFFADQIDILKDGTTLIAADLPLGLPHPR